MPLSVQERLQDFLLSAGNQPRTVPELEDGIGSRSGRVFRCLQEYAGRTFVEEGGRWSLTVRGLRPRKPMRVSRRQPAGSVRVDVSIPTALRAAMDSHPGRVNWSGVAAEAFRAELARVEPRAGNVNGGDCRE